MCRQGGGLKNYSATSREVVYTHYFFSELDVEFYFFFAIVKF